MEGAFDGVLETATLSRGCDVIAGDSVGGDGTSAPGAERSGLPPSLGRFTTSLSPYRAAPRKRRVASRQVATGLVGLLIVRGEIGWLALPSSMRDSPTSSSSSMATLHPGNGCPPSHNHHLLPPVRPSDAESPLAFSHCVAPPRRRARANYVRTFVRYVRSDSRSSQLTSNESRSVPAVLHSLLLARPHLQ